MPTVAAYNRQLLTDAPQVFNTRGATGMEITIYNGAATLRFAHADGVGIAGGFGLEEEHPPKILTIEDERIEQVSARNAVPGQPPTYVTILATREGGRPGRR